MTRLIVVSGVLLGGVLLGSGIASSQSYPDRPIRIIAAEVGGAGDYVSRVVGLGLTAAWGKQVIVDNRASNGPQLAARAPADGYTLFLSGPAFWIAPLMQPVTWDPIKEFVPVIIAARAPAVLVIQPSLPVNSVKELIAIAKAKPGDLNYGSSGVGAATHLAAELFKMMAGVDIVRVNYKGVAPAVNDAISGRIQLMFPAAASAAPHIRSGKLKALAVTTSQPSPLFPGLPTVSASGVPDYEAVATMAVFAPAKTSATIVNRIARDIDNFVKGSDAKEKFLNNGMETVGGTPGQLAGTIKAETAKWAKVVRQADIRAD